MKKTITLLAAGLILAGSAKAQLANGNMELWRTYTSGTASLEAPNNWYGLDSTIASFGILLGGPVKKQVEKSTDKHGGTYAAKLTSVTYPAFGVLPSVLSNAHVAIDIANQDFTLSGGTAVTQRINSVTAWVKYLPKGNDSGIVGISAIIQGAGAGGSDSVVGDGFVMLSSLNSYTQITVPVTYVTPTVVPTHIQIGFISSNYTDGVDSSMMYVDDVTLNAASGISQTLFRSKIVSCYPNPAGSNLQLATNEEQPLLWEAMAANGQVIATKEFTKAATVSLGNMPAGTYFYRVFNRNKEMVQTGKFTKE